ncbi:hypothetical protein BDZ97DRAFT_1846959, partial [Flammula alnicola]
SQVAFSSQLPIFLQLMYTSLIFFFVALELPFVSSTDLHFSKQGLSGVSRSNQSYLVFWNFASCLRPASPSVRDASQIESSSSHLNLCKMRDVPMRNRRSFQGRDQAEKVGIGNCASP